jgi:hypothetical protein
VPEAVHDASDLVRFAKSVFARIEIVFSNAPLRLSKQVAGTRFDIATTVDEQAGLFADRIAEGNGVGTACAPARILAACAGELGLPAPPVVAGALKDPQTLEKALASTRWRVHHHAATRFWQIWDGHSRMGLQLMAAPAMLPPWENGSPLRNLLKWGLTSPTQGLLHAGTLAIDGRGMLFVGRGGSGKSGTVLAGLCGGLESVGDDYVLAKMEGDQIYSLPLFHTLKCDAKGLERLGQLGRTDLRTRGENWQGKYEFTFPQLTGRPPAQALRITALCLPDIAHAERSHFEPLSQREAFLALTLTGLAQLPGDRAANFALCAQITRQLPCMRLRLGTDATEIARTIRSALISGQTTC